MKNQSTNKAARRKILCLISMLPFIGFNQFARADTFPSKPITLIVPFTAGAGTDIIARSIAEKMQKLVGQPVIVDNRPGAAGVIGTNFVAKAPRDGYTLLFTPNSFSFANLISGNPKQNYDPVSSFDPVIEVGTTPMFLVTGEQSGMNTFEQALAAAKKNPASYGSAGTGSILHLVGELVNQSTGINLTHVPYKGTSQAMVDVLGGQIPYAYGALSTVDPYIKTGKLKILATTGSQRTALAPEVPTLAEKGYKDVNLSAWYGIFAPKGTNPAAISLLNSNLNQILKMPAIIEAMRSQGTIATGGSADRLAATNANDVATLQSLVKKLNLSEK